MYKRQIIDSIGNGTVTNAEIAVVISNNRSAYALERAKQNGIDAAVVSPKDYETREAFNRALLEKIQSYQVDLVVLAGCLVVIPKIMLDEMCIRDSPWERSSLHRSLREPMVCWK